MDKIRGRIILTLLCIYPFYSFLAVKYFQIDPNYFAGILAYIFGVEVVLTRFGQNRNLILPRYLFLLALFFLYTFLSSIFISEQLYQIGLIKYLYHDPFLRALVLLFVIENTPFEQKAISRSLHILLAVLIIASLVSVRQIYDPLFYQNLGLGEDYAGSFERYQQYLESLGGDRVKNLTPLKEGYRYSIYSWISGISVGMDAMAIFSILLGLNNMSKIKALLLVCSAGFISFLSSSRWIMLNFISILSQKMIGRKNPLIYAFKLLSGLALVLLLVTQGASYFGVNISKMVQERLLSESANTRIYAFEVFGKVYPERPIFGTGGMDTDRMTMLIQGRTSQIHVGWLKLFYYYGLVGGLIYISFIIVLMQYLYRLARAHNYWGSFFAMLAFVIANCTLVEFSIFYHGLLLAILYARYLKNKPQEDADDFQDGELPHVQRRTLVLSEEY